MTNYSSKHKGRGRERETQRRSAGEERTFFRKAKTSHNEVTEASLDVMEQTIRNDAFFDVYQRLSSLEPTSKRQEAATARKLKEHGGRSQMEVEAGEQAEETERGALQ
ncbi:hypothetical protein MBLNU457_g2690t1 [Dothideomycetes sp. NU457]